MNDFSGKFVLRIPSSLHKELKEKAEMQGVSLNALIVHQLESHQQTTEDGTANLLFLLKKIFAQDFVGLVLFGSTARGENRRTSDIDILIVLKRSIDRSLYRLWDDKVAAHVSSKFEPQFVNLPALSLKASSLWLEVALEGKILYDKDGSLENYLQILRSQIASGDYQRKMSHGHPYWVKRESEYAK